jgi:hypothetical protein
MPVNWTIKGEAGQGWDDSVTTLEVRNISSAKLDFKSLEADELTFNIALQDVTNAQYVATPVVNPDSSVQIGSTISVTVTCATAGATIRYTTDGSNPNSSSPVVANGATLTIANPSTLRVFAEKAGLLDSDTQVAEYVVQGVVATGGSVTDTTGFRTHTFVSSGSFVVTNPGTIEYLVVAGGGAGGGNSSTRSGGGGGAGGLKAGSIAITAGTYAITVGAGGMALVPQTSASDGGGSSIGTLVTCSGGGGGASVSGTTAVAGRAGGSGGGGTCAGAAGTGITGQGRNGGGSASTTSGTGGGSGAAGTAVSAATANGGAGTSSSITGPTYVYALGGGVSLTPDNSVVPASGYGGNGMFKSTTTTRIGANGSSGIVVIKYATVQAPNPSNIPSLNTVIPTLRQEVTLYRDGVSFFFGNVTNVRSSIQSGSHDFQITVSGPWWFLEKVPFTSVRQDGSGTSGERITYVFGTASAGQNLKTSIEQAIDRANQLGCPIAPISGGSSVAAMSAFPRITLNQSTCGQVISELVRLVPDAMSYFDYATYPAKLIVTRRPTATEVTFNQSTSPITLIDINPIIELEVQQVTLPSVTRNTVGRTVFQKQESGSAQTGKNITKRQVITISGPELDTFLPNDLFENQTITTSGSIANLAHDSDSSCVNAAKNAGLSRLPIGIGYTAVTLVDVRTRADYFGPPSSYVITKNFNVGGYSIKDKSGNSLSGYSIITSGTPADWAGITTVNVTVSGSMYLIWTKDTGDGTPSTVKPSYIDAAGFSFVESGFRGQSSDSDWVFYYQKAFSFSAVATPGGSSSTTVYKPADYSFINPPAGLADFLKSSQNWIPYEGAITLEEEEVGATRYRGNKINLINSLPAFSTMGALVSGESLEIESGRTTINLGAPARNDYRTLVDKIRKTSQDNIVYV